ncbi:hypothetical protein SPRG_02961 [Saprolegnia parasitica CBS 223.65]|uniref:Diacylglycerol kinase n=1 Tax=Saprolegnia parasitica (strain CBS 223.65) TaxID=695850 RepID=A0A067CP50_SAPPC|nr:hypothetical protein SPRG_02961 [Saprolegnia parasitica CBS 223.65]KDO32484.1 hypothetical protein SPRG_02961 [Saprolegnia parasitica CBS 223.65]|eukprot:XP_012196933.1 hypothetical protein SPRG_02961 [Saprolegnia parasitica CBS 223.65]
MSWVLSIAGALAAIIAFYLCANRLVLFFSTISFQDGPYVLGVHQWRSNNRAGPHWCNICESVAYGIRSNVVSCDICGITAHGRCALLYLRGGGLPERCACKVAAVPIDSDARALEQHAWVKGNIDPLDTCDICGLFCGSILALSAIQCAWCHRRVHETCFHNGGISPACDYGPHERLILPPSSIRIQPKPTVLSSVKSAVQKIKSRALQHRSSSSSKLATTDDDASPMKTRSGTVRQRRATETSITPPPSAGYASSLHSSLWLDAGCNRATTTEVVEVDTDEMLPYVIEQPIGSTPLLVFINSRSGGQMGVYVLRQLRKWLNPLQIYDLSVPGGPRPPLLQFRHVTALQILVCGGDGTVGWVLGTIDELVAQGLLRQPPVAILPLGTGNDLARILGWGGGYSDQRISDILSDLENAHTCLLDRWRVDLNGAKHCVLNNYFGVGVDAQVALEFHEQRERSPALFMSQFINKLWYSRFGAKNFITRTCANLETKIQLVCDGEPIALPSGIEGVIVANINSYGGGSVLWHDVDVDNEYTFMQPQGQQRFLDLPRCKMVCWMSWLSLAPFIWASSRSGFRKQFVSVNASTLKSSSSSDSRFRLTASRACKTHATLTFRSSTRPLCSARRSKSATRSPARSQRRWIGRAIPRSSHGHSATFFSLKSFGASNPSRCRRSGPRSSTTCDKTPKYELAAS